MLAGLLDGGLLKGRASSSGRGRGIKPLSSDPLLALPTLSVPPFLLYPSYLPLLPGYSYTCSTTGWRTTWRTSILGKEEYISPTLLPIPSLLAPYLFGYPLHLLSFLSPPTSSPTELLRISRSGSAPLQCWTTFASQNFSHSLYLSSPS